MPISAAAPAPRGFPVPPSGAHQTSIEERLEELAVYSESGDPVGTGDNWHVPESAELFGKDGFTFRDFLDIVNPLQHIPVVSTLYRAATGDTLDPGARLLGGTLFGGIGGFAAALVNAVVEDETGADIGAHVLAAMTDDDGSGGSDIAALTMPPTKPPAMAAGTPAPTAAPVPSGARRAGQPTSLLPTAGIFAPAAHAAQVAPAAPAAMARADAPASRPLSAPAGAVPRLMMDALDKYEALGRARRGQAIAEEI